jgi:DNA recombination protein RmuC
MQGNWGELVLERVLEKSGLGKGEYEVAGFHNRGRKPCIPGCGHYLPDGKR